MPVATKIKLDLLMLLWLLVSMLPAAMSMRGMGRMVAMMTGAPEPVQPMSQQPQVDDSASPVFSEVFDTDEEFEVVSGVILDDSDRLTSLLQRLSLLDGGEDSLKQPEWMRFPGTATRSISDFSTVTDSWAKRGNFPLSASSSRSVAFEASRVLQFKAESNIPRPSVDNFLKGTYDLILEMDGPNLYPPSLYACKEVLGVPPLADFTVPAVAGISDWIYFGVEHAVRELFLDPLFVSNLYQDRVRPEYDAWGGRHISQVHDPAQVASDLFHPDNGLYELGLDWVQPFEWKTYSLGLIFLRSWNLHGCMRSKSRFFKCLAIIPGPSEPPTSPDQKGHSFQTYVDRIVDDFTRLCTGFQVTDANDRSFNHIPFLVAWSADTPAGAKIKTWEGHAGVFGCDRCSFQGIWYHGAVRWLGYFERSAQYILYGNDKMWHARDAPRYSAKFLKRLSETDAPHRPFTLLSRLSELDTFDIVHSVLIPVCHKFTEGVVKNFFIRIHADMSKQTKSIVTKRVSVLRDCAVFGKYSSREIADPVLHLLSHSFEQLKSLICGYGIFLYRRLLKPYQWRLLVLLHKIAVYLLCRRFKRCELLRRKVQSWLDEFAKESEKYFSVSFFTHNLHQVVAHLLDQEDYFGLTSYLMESWVERCMQFAKRVTRYHATKDPHKVIANYILMQSAILRQSYLYGISTVSGKAYAPRMFLKETVESVSRRCGQLPVVCMADRVRYYRKLFISGDVYDSRQRPLVYFDGPLYGTLLAFVVIENKALALIDYVQHSIDADDFISVQFGVEFDGSGRMLVAVDKIISVVDYIVPDDPNDISHRCMVIHSLLHPYVK